jgi:hypothetical protein
MPAAVTPATTAATSAAAQSANNGLGGSAAGTDANGTPIYNWQFQIQPGSYGPTAPVNETFGYNTPSQANYTPPVTVSYTGATAADAFNAMIANQAKGSSVYNIFRGNSPNQTLTTQAINGAVNLGLTGYMPNATPAAAPAATPATPANPLANTPNATVGTTTPGTPAVTQAGGYILPGSNTAAPLPGLTAGQAASFSQMTGGQTAIPSAGQLQSNTQAILAQQQLAAAAGGVTAAGTVNNPGALAQAVTQKWRNIPSVVSGYGPINIAPVAGLAS